jgi:hypothetical protein
MKSIPIELVHAESDKFSKKRSTVNKIFKDLGEEVVIDNHTITVYPLPDLTKQSDSSNIVGVVVHMRPNNAILGSPMGADESFTALHNHATQDQWQRLPVRHKGRKLVSSHTFFWNLSLTHYR